MDVTYPRTGSFLHLTIQYEHHLDGGCGIPSQAITWCRSRDSVSDDMDVDALTLMQHQAGASSAHAAEAQVDQNDTQPPEWDLGLHDWCTLPQSWPPRRQCAVLKPGTNAGTM